MADLLPGSGLKRFQRDFCFALIPTTFSFPWQSVLLPQQLIYFVPRKKEQECTSNGFLHVFVLSLGVVSVCHRFSFRYFFECDNRDCISVPKSRGCRAVALSSFPFPFAVLFVSPLPELELAST